MRHRSQTQRRNQVGPWQLVDVVVFSSDCFSLAPAQDADSIPGVCGRALRDWLVERLEDRGFRVCSIRSTPDGHVITLREQPVRLTATCGGVRGEQARWRIVIGMEQASVRPVSWYPNARTEIAAARRLIRSLVETLPDVSAIAWESCMPERDGEFTQPTAE